MAPSSDYYDEFQWCPKCRQDVHYLRSLDQSYCINCGGVVRMFRTKKEALEFQRAASVIERLPWARPPH